MLVLTKTVLLAIVCVVVAFFMPVFSEADMVDAVVAVVNDDVILSSELERAVSSYMRTEDNIDISESNRAFPKDIRSQVLALLINEKLIEQLSRRFDIMVTDDEVDLAIGRIKDFNKGHDLDEVLRLDEISMEDFRRNLSIQILKSKFIERHVYSRITITEDNIQTYYDDNSDLYGGQIRYHLCTVLFNLSSDSDDEERESFFDILEDISKELTSGADFDSLAETFSSLENGYMEYLGAFSDSELSQQTLEAIEGLRISECTPIFKKGSRLQFFYIKDITKIDVIPLKMVRNEIYQKLLSKEFDREFSLWLDSVKNTSSIEIVYS